MENPHRPLSKNPIEKPRPVAPPLNMQIFIFQREIFIFYFKSVVFSPHHGVTAASRCDGRITVRRSTSFHFSAPHGATEHIFFSAPHHGGSTSFHFSAPHHVAPEQQLCVFQIFIFFFF
jgi:hypothetical protein